MIKASYTFVCNPLYFPVIHMFYIGVVYPTYTHVLYTASEHHKYEYIIIYIHKMISLATCTGD